MTQPVARVPVCVFSLVSLRKGKEKTCKMWRSLLRAFLFAYGGMRAAAAIHGKLLRAVLRARMSFFDNTPLGRILNRSILDVLIIRSPVGIRKHHLKFFFSLTNVGKSGIFFIHSSSDSVNSSVSGGGGGVNFARI